MISDRTDLQQSETAFVWIWLPGATQPIASGRLDRDRDVLVFTYGRRYLARDDAISLFAPELPLASGPQLPLSGPRRRVYPRCCA